MFVVDYKEFFKEENYYIFFFFKDCGGKFLMFIVKQGVKMVRLIL